jgi:spermidine synthase
LAIFMGGMAVGAWAASRLSARWRDLLLAYAIIEVLIGLSSLVFHNVFVDATAFALESAIPALAGSPTAIQVFKWTLSAALILPQSVLLGMTFPLMTGGVLRLRPERAGYVIAMLYFTNSLGAAVGVLVSGFYLIGAVGLPGTLAAAAVLNLVVAGAVMLLPRKAPPISDSRAPVPKQAAVPQARLLLAVAALTGLSSFMYEIGWIRMLALVLGGSTHAFELMLSAFILGIAFGGLWVRRRIEAAQDSLRFLAWVQLAMGAAALATLPIYGSTFHAMQAVLAMVAPSPAGYSAFNFASHLLCLAVMFPAAFCAGMTLPLITAALLRRGAGERAIGQVYAVNTAGAIAGVLIAVHVGLPLLGLKGLIVAGAAIDLALGVALLWKEPRAIATGAALASIALVVAGAVVRLDAHHMASGVYRWGSLLDDPRAVKLHIDGKTATVSITSDEQIVTLRTNGKADGAARIDGGPPVQDEMTMVLAGALPLVLLPDAQRVANIGFGTGMTTHVLLASPRVEVVDTVEIEPAVVQAAAAHFRRFNWRALDDPRSRIHYDDAKSYFSAQPVRYDVIVSEPSNPWVSGVAGLFSYEFYRDVRRYLRDGGLFVQWVNLYEMAPLLLATVVVALDANFEDYEFWLANDSDLLIVAAHNGKVPRAAAAAFENAELAGELARLGVRNLDDLHLHRLGGRGALGPYFAAFGAPPNSDFFPILELQAPLARHMRASATEVVRLTELAAPLVTRFDGEPRAQPDPARLSDAAGRWTPRAGLARQARAASEFARSGRTEALAHVNTKLVADLVLARAALTDCRVQVPPAALHAALAELAHGVSAHLPGVQAEAFWATFARGECPRANDAANARWLRLHRAVAVENAKEITAAAAALLQAEGDLQGHLLARALSAYMAGEILQGNAPAAMRAWVTHRGRLGPAARQWEPVFRFLSGQATNGAQLSAR